MIPLANTEKFAIVSPEDHAKVLASGYSPNWYIRFGHVTTYRRDTNKAGAAAQLTVRVDRIILGIDEPHRFRDHRPKHVNGDPLDLRRQNLKLTTVRLKNREGREDRYGMDDRRQAPHVR